MPGRFLLFFSLLIDPWAKNLWVGVCMCVCVSMLYIILRELQTFFTTGGVTLLVIAYSLYAKRHANQHTHRNQPDGTAQEVGRGGRYDT